MMSEADIARGDIVIASAGMILYRYTKTGNIEVLVGKRSGEPWKGCYLCVFGGLVQPEDKNVFTAAIREAMEETGGKLCIKPQGIRIGTFGPKSFHHLLSLNKKNQVQAVKTNTLISIRHSFAMTVYAGLVVSGKPRDTREVKELCFECPHVLASKEAPFAFEQALILQKFCKRFVYNYQDA
ncbi:MAG: NUDIX hydrolase [Candidatus Sungbacteria bacterium]|nr:NUDIX hydrolase [Candidatus Sungbacteria bacterium]